MESATHLLSHTGVYGAGTLPSLEGLKCARIFLIFTLLKIKNKCLVLIFRVSAIIS